jgi:uncharacterized membrane protein YoaK (UPF0700 family)
MKPNPSDAPKPNKTIQFGVKSLFGVVLWAAMVLGAWRSGLLQPQLMPIVFPLVSALGVYAVLLVIWRFEQRR